MKTLLRLYKLYGMMDLLWFLRDTKYCLLYIFTDLITMVCSMAGIFLLSSRFGGFGGMSQGEILLMLGYAATADGIYQILFTGNNTGMISRIIGRGQLDHAMIQPVPLWMHLLAQGFTPVSANASLLCGIGITWYALSGLALTITPVWLLFFAINVTSSCLILLAVMYLLSCLAFYAPAAAEEIAQSGMDLFLVKTYPLGGLSGKAKLVFCGFIPVGLGAWFPINGLIQLGKMVPSGEAISYLHFSLILTPLMAVFLIIITAFFFQKGMNYYAAYGSPRYSGFGLR